MGKGPSRGPQVSVEKITPDYVRECFSYDPLTGVLTWKVRPREHFLLRRNWLGMNTRFAGKVAGSEQEGYIRVSLAVDGVSHPFYAHRLAYCIVHGSWPEFLVDHWDLNGTNNQWENLRHATVPQNTANSRVRCTNQLGVKGVSKKRKKFMAQIDYGGKHCYLGTFDTIEQAADAYAAAAKIAHGQFARS
jgi:hypothetical protein